MRAIEPVTRTDGEILQDMVREFGGAIVNDRAALTDQIRSKIAIVREIAGKPNLWNGPFWGNRRDNNDRVKHLRASIDKLCRELDALPDQLSLSLFAPVESENLDTIADEAAGHAKLFGAMLGNLSARCDRIIAEKVGEHGAAGDHQNLAALAARELMENRGLRPTNGRPYRQIASLLYEAITGEQGQDIERACKAMLHAAIRTE